MKKLQILFLIAVAIWFWGCDKPGESKGDQFSLNLAGKEGAVPVKVLWEYKGLPGKMEIYELASQRPVKLWDTQAYDSIEKAPVSKPIEDSKLVLVAGDTRKFALVYKNPLNETLHFFAAPHSVQPPEFGFGFKFKCLCVNHLFKVGPNQVWVRVVELRTMPNWKSDPFQITHTLIRVAADQAAQWEKPESGSGNPD
ncbi:LIC11469 family lipoprotein adhesin Lsa20 [Leptospira perolatii]|uniref:LIC11469 family lipoprotein adhesin Lsa20 n=1 Tax=Leptospira perolatii TaxID=2023191 RepID=UPI001FB02C08|nr:hypothetical protein [Leptospira perolatii]